MKEPFVDNDVWKYSISLKDEMSLDDITVYTNPFPEPWDKNYDSAKHTLSLEDKKNLVQEKYFTKEKIAELKQKLVEKIMSEENPFDISCVDVDGGYLVTEEELFKIEL